jgi:hypothetical protein
MANYDCYCNTVKGTRKYLIVWDIGCLVIVSIRNLVNYPGLIIPIPSVRTGATPNKT